jgi:hypothetical protein
MITAFNELLLCFVTGLFTALIMWLMAKFGMFPIIIMVPMDKVQEEDDA